MNQTHEEAVFDTFEELQEDSQEHTDETTTEEDQVAEQPEDEPQPEGEETVDEATDEDSSEDGDVTDDDEQPKKGDTVPVAALVEERRQWKEKLADMEGRLKNYDGLDARLKAWEDEQAKAKAEQEEEAKPKAPEFEFDPTGNLKHRLDENQQAVEQMVERQKSIQENMEQRDNMAMFQQALGTDETNFRADHDDYDAALDHMRQTEASKLKMFYPDATEQQIQQELANAELRMAAQWMQSGQSPSAMAYQLATDVYGYQRAEGEESSQTSKEAEAVNRVAKGKRAASTNKGGAPGTRNSVEDLTRSTPAEFDAAMAELFPNYRP